MIPFSGSNSWLKIITISSRKIWKAFDVDYLSDSFKKSWINTKMTSVHFWNKVWTHLDPKFGLNVPKMYLKPRNFHKKCDFLISCQFLTPIVTPICTNTPEMHFFALIMLISSKICDKPFPFNLFSSYLKENIQIFQKSSFFLLLAISIPILPIKPIAQNKDSIMDSPYDCLKTKPSSQL